MESCIVVPVYIAVCLIVAGAGVLSAVPVTGSELILLAPRIAVVVPIHRILIIVVGLESLPDAVGVEGQQQGHHEDADGEHHPGRDAVPELPYGELCYRTGLTVEARPHRLTQSPALLIHHESPPTRYPSRDSRLSSGFSIEVTLVPELTMTRGRME